MAGEGTAFHLPGSGRDVRRYIFGLFVGDSPDDLPANAPIKMDFAAFCGTAFFITRNGIALSAAHCIPNEIPAGKALLAATWNGSAPLWIRVDQCLVPIGSDLAILKLTAGLTSYFEPSFERPTIGQDVSTLGFPSTIENLGEYDLRCLKGHITAAARPNQDLDLSFPVPRGMSGSPLLSSDGRAIGLVRGTNRSELVEEETEDSGGSNATRIVTKRVIQYGAAEGLWRYADWEFPDATGSQGLSRFIEARNRVDGQRAASRSR